ncbi:Acyl-CoA synthetase family member 4 [Thelohanellus kitauei]|uniref:Acyl-CoA synthetase family member 4 n=1 Tax=Thelohanellus kitauei TaxID=669202 RepID=A0A0C2M2T7_THEKT|nr:Acyl-CoA synthetase family member 4 [Thelohanellus kitauei]
MNDSPMGSSFKDNYDEEIFLVSKHLFIEKVDLGKNMNSDHPLIVSYVSGDRYIMTYAKIQEIFHELDDFIRSLYESFNRTLETTVIIVAASRNIFGICFCIYSLVKGIIFIPVDAHDPILFSFQIKSLQNVFRNAILLAQSNFDLEQALRAVGFIEINGFHQVTLAFLPDTPTIYVVSLEIMGSGYTLYHIINKKSPIMYVSYSSGTTALPKSVLVTYSSFLAVLEDSVKNFGVVRSSIILLSSPFTFDPSILQICWVLATKCTLLMLEKRLLSKSLTVSRIFLESKLSHLQCTPSLLYHFGVDNLKTLIADIESNLQYIILGGEKFPSPKFFQRLLPDIDQLKNVPTFVNIYGTTEVSPWMSFYLLEPQELKAYQNGQFCMPIIGTCFKDTEYSIEPYFDDIGKLYTKTRYRLCFVITNNQQIKRDDLHSLIGPSTTFTGDLVRKEPQGIMYHSRYSNCIKRFGKMVNLEAVNRLIQENNQDYIKDSVLLSVDDGNETSATPTNSEEHNICLKLYFTSSVSGVVLQDKIMENLRKCLPSIYLPDETIQVKEIPLNSNDKVDIKRLVKLHKSSGKQQTVYVDTKGTLRDLMIRVFSQKPEIKIEEIDMNDNFVEMGGDSLMAAFVLDFIKQNLFEENNIRSYDENALLLVLQNQSINDLCGAIDKMRYLSTVTNNKSSSEFKLRVSKQWEIDTRKCIDANPLVIGETSEIYIGSHSGTFYRVDLVSGEVIWKYQIKERIVGTATITVDGKYIVVGSYDCNVYCFERSGELAWGFKTMDIVKTQAVATVCNDVIICSYDGFVYYLNVDSHKMVWKVSIDGKILPSKPFFDESSRRIFVATAGGTVCCMDMNGQKIWETQLEHPIFSGLYANVNYLIVSEVKGRIFKLDGANGSKICEFCTGGTIYANPLIDETSHHIYISTMEGVIYKLSIQGLACVIKIDLETTLHCPPIILTCCSNPESIPGSQDSYLITATQSGELYFIDKDELIVKEVHQLDYQWSTSPVCVKNHVLIGSHQDKLVCYKIDNKIDN